MSQEVEKAIPVLEDAAGVSDDGKIYDQLSYVYLEADRYDECISATSRAINKGGLRKVQGTYFIQGLCQYNQKKYTESRKSMVDCRNEARRKKDDLNIKTCAQWITFIDREVDRNRQLAAAAAGG